MKISSHLFHIVEQPVRDLLCWLWFLILCKLPLFTFPPSSLNLNLYVLNSRSHDCGSIRPIQPKTMDAASPMVWRAVKYQVGWLSTHCSYSNPSSRKPLSISNNRLRGRKKGQKFSLEGGAILQCNKCTRYTGKTCSLTYIFGMLWNHTLIDRLAKRDIVVIRRGENWPWIVHHGTTLLATILRNLENKMFRKTMHESQPLWTCIVVHCTRVRPRSRTVLRRQFHKFWGADSKNWQRYKVERQGGTACLNLKVWNM